MCKYFIPLDSKMHISQSNLKGHIRLFFLLNIKRCHRSTKDFFFPLYTIGSHFFHHVGRESIPHMAQLKAAKQTFFSCQGMFSTAP